MRINYIFPVLLSLVITICLFCRVATGSEARFQPSILISEEYNDNIFLEAIGGKEEYITRIQPSLEFKYNAPLWEWAIRYQLQYRYYAEDTRGDEAVHDLIARGNVILLKEFFFVDIIDIFGRVSLDAARDFTRESEFVNQDDRNILTVNPYFRKRLSRNAVMTPGYIYQQTWYEGSRAVDKSSSIAYVDMEKETSEKMKLNIGYRHVWEDNEIRDFDKNDIYAGARYEYGDYSFFVLQAGNSWLDFEDGGNYNQVFWSAEITHAFNALSGTVRSALTYEENPLGTPLRVNTYMATLNRNPERLSMGLSARFIEYSDAVTKSLLTTRYGISFDIGYEFTRATTGYLNVIFERYDDESAGTYTKLYLADLKVDYEIMKSILMTLAYRHAENDSPQVPQDEYANNRVTFGIRKNF